MPTIKGNIGDTLIISGRSGMKYVDKDMKEYYIDSEMIISDKYDFVIYPKSIKYYNDYERENDQSNIEYHEEYDEISGCGTGKIVYKRRYISDISAAKRAFVLERIIVLLKQGHIKAVIK